MPIGTLTPDAIDLFTRAVLCWLATSDADGSPSVSPKEIFTVPSAEQILIADISSPRSVRNILAQPRVCVAAIDVFDQVGYQAYGHARVIDAGTTAFAEVVGPLRDLAGPDFAIRSVIAVEVDRLSRIVAPSIRMRPEMPDGERRARTLRTYGVTDLAH